MPFWRFRSGYLSVPRSVRQIIESRMSASRTLACLFLISACCMQADTCANILGSEPLLPAADQQVCPFRINVNGFHISTGGGGATFLRPPDGGPKNMTKPFT